MKQSYSSLVCFFLIFLFSTVHAAPAEQRFKYVRVDKGVMLEYRVSGPKHGSPILLIHGVTDSSHSWSSVIPYIDRTYRVYTPTLRGHGNSTKPVRGYQIPAFAQDMIAFMNKMRIKRAVVVGHSLGSLVAHQLASLFPERISHLILVGSAPTLVDNPVITYRWDEVIGLPEFQNPINPDFIRELTETAKVPARVWTVF